MLRGNRKLVALENNGTGRRFLRVGTFYNNIPDKCAWTCNQFFK